MLAPRLPPQLLVKALNAARAIDDGWWRAWALCTLVPWLPLKEKHNVLGEALHAAPSISSDEVRSKVLRTLAAQLPQEERGRVLPDARRAPSATIVAALRHLLRLCHI